MQSSRDIELRILVMSAKECKAGPCVVRGESGATGDSEGSIDLVAIRSTSAHGNAAFTFSPAVKLAGVADEVREHLWTGQWSAMTRGGDLRLGKQAHERRNDCDPLCGRLRRVAGRRHAKRGERSDHRSSSGRDKQRTRSGSGSLTSVAAPLPILAWQFASKLGSSSPSRVAVNDTSSRIYTPLASCRKCGAR